MLNSPHKIKLILTVGYRCSEVLNLEDTGSGIMFSKHKREEERKKNNQRRNICMKHAVFIEFFLKSKETLINGIYIKLYQLRIE